MEYLKDPTLGLLLFLLYINDLPQHIPNAEVVLFVDYINNW
jgi:hypothetical protein